VSEGHALLFATGRALQVEDISAFNDRVRFSANVTVLGRNRKRSVREA
jgi:hypothetical protein